MIKIVWVLYDYVFFAGLLIGVFHLVTLVCTFYWLAVRLMFCLVLSLFGVCSTILLAFVVLTYVVGCVLGFAL